MSGASLLTEAGALEYEGRLRRLIAAGGEPAEFTLARAALRPLFVDASARFPGDAVKATFFMLTALAAAAAMVNGIIPERRAELKATADKIRGIHADLVEENLIVGFKVTRGDPPKGSPASSGPPSPKEGGP